MDEKSASGEPKGHPPLHSERPRLRDAVELLNARRYQQVERLLGEQQEAAQRSGQMAMVIILAAASQLCLSCRQFQADRELHELGLEEATRRERESQDQIRAVLTMLSQLSPLEAGVASIKSPALTLDRLEPAEPEENQAEKQPTVLGRVKQLLGTFWGSPTAKYKVGTARHQREPATSPYERTDSALALKYLAEELEMLEKSGESLSTEQAILRKVAASLTASDEQSDDALASFIYKSREVESRQISSQPIEEDNGSMKVEGPPASKDRPTANGPGEDPVPGGQQPMRTISGQKPATKSVETRRDNFEDVDVGKNEGSPSLTVHCLGPFQVYANDKPIEKWPSSKGKSIFKYLINNRERSVAKEVLMDLFWPDADPDAARNNLNVAIYGLRQAFRNGETEFSHVLYKDEHYLLNPELQIWLDVDEFRAHFQKGQGLRREGLAAEAAREFHAAEALYQGEFLEEDRYEEWLLPLRRQLTNAYLELLEYLSQYYFHNGEYTACITICRSMLAIDACLEDTHGRLMRCHYRQGQQHLALRQYHQCVQALKEELEVSPGSSIEELYAKLRQQEPI